MAIKIGSFNVRNLADGEGRDIDRIARIINENQLDIVCLQEVLQGGKIIKGISLNDLSGQAKAYDRSLRRRLTGEWDSEWQEPKLRRGMEQYLGGDKRGEGYAILWRTNRLSLVKDENGDKIRPTIYTRYDTRIAKSKLSLIREPLYARFIVGNRPAELRIISTHIIYGKRDSAKDILDYGMIEMRKKEFNILAGQIYYRISEMRKDINCTSPYTIMMGDYNLNLDMSLCRVVCYDQKGHEVSEDSSFFKVFNLQDEKSTLKKDIPELANSYDHFTVDIRTNAQVVENSVSVIDAIHKHVNNANVSEEDAFNRYRKEVSDHLPIIISINI